MTRTIISHNISSWRRNKKRGATPPCSNCFANKFYDLFERVWLENNWSSHATRRIIAATVVELQKKHTPLGLHKSVSLMLSTLQVWWNTTWSITNRVVEFFAAANEQLKTQESLTDECPFTNTGTKIMMLITVNWLLSSNRLVRWFVFISFLVFFDHHSAEKSALDSDEEPLIVSSIQVAWKSCCFTVYCLVTLSGIKIFRK